MADTQTQARGVYVSYNEEKNGSFDEAVEISRTRGCLTWLDRSPMRMGGIYPAPFFVRLTGQERYFRGILLSIQRAEDLADDFAAGESNHRSAQWRNRNPAPRPGQDFQTVFYIAHLHEVPRPAELGDLKPPQHPAYVS